MITWDSQRTGSSIAQQKSMSNLPVNPIGFSCGLRKVPNACHAWQYSLLLGTLSPLLERRSPDEHLAIFQRAPCVLYLLTPLLRACESGRCHRPLTEASSSFKHRFYKLCLRHLLVSAFVRHPRVKAEVKVCSTGPEYLKPHPQFLQVARAWACVSVKAWYRPWGATSGCTALSKKGRRSSSPSGWACPLKIRWRMAR
jgi:hypothetical protein